MLDDLDDLHADEHAPEGGATADARPTVGQAGGSPALAYRGDPSALYPIPPVHRIWSATVLIPALSNGAPGGSSLNGAQPTMVLQTESYAEAVDWHVEVQAFIPSTTFEGSPGVLYIILQYQQGQTQLTKSYQVRGTAPRVIHVHSRDVRVSAVWLGATTNPLPASQPVTVSCGVGGVNDPPLAQRLQQWVHDGGGGSSATGVISTEPALFGAVQGGYLTAATIILTAMTGDPVCYLMFFDSAGPTPTGSQLPILVSPPLTGANQWVAFNDEADPQVMFSAGLIWALSSTPNNYTASSGSGTAQVDVKICQ
jgi:hypothetical protein